MELFKFIFFLASSIPVGIATLHSFSFITAWVSKRLDSISSSLLGLLIICALTCVFWVAFEKTVEFLARAYQTPKRFWGAYHGSIFGLSLAISFFILFKATDVEALIILTSMFLALIPLTIKSKSYQPISSFITRRFLDEVPIQDQKEDILNMETSISEIVSAISSPWNKGGAIIAVYGANGIGKSSCVRLAINRVSSSHHNIVFAYFEPYRYPDETEMVRNFFEAIIEPLNQRYTLPGLGSISRKLTELVYGISAEHTVSIPIGKIVGLLFPLETLESIQERIDGYLSVLNIRVLIVVDDIDRCSVRKRHLFFQMVNTMRCIENSRILVTGSVYELLGRDHPKLVSITD